MSSRWIFFLGLLIGGTQVGQAQDIDFGFLQTRAEATRFMETSSYEEVRAFAEIAVNASDRLHQTTFGYSSEGRALPLIVFGDVAGADSASVWASGKTRIFIQANIHAGEVCGKEALLMLMRALAAGRHDAWADSLVILMAPLYNADGNERVSLSNRPRQNGPLGGMGQRPNAQGLDLNRDHMKVDAPEARSLVRLMRRYDPHVVVDLHTTNGTYHGYHLTYAPPLHPNTPAPVDSLLRQAWLPAVTRVIKERYGWEYYYYGNIPPPGSGAERGWYTFDHRPRFNNNYVGLRNRLAILSEAYAYASFEERVLATLYFVEEILHYAHDHAGLIRAIGEAADAETVVGQRLAVRAGFQRSDEPADILMGAVVETRHPFTGELVLERQDILRPEKMYTYGTFQATETAIAPRSYLIPDSLDRALDRLDVHGVRYTRLATDSTLQVERFRIEEAEMDEQSYQGHRQQALSGAYETTTLTVPAGTVLVEVAQPLGRLAFSLLEPRSDDGLLNWGLIPVPDGTLRYYPIYRIPSGR